MTATTTPEASRELRIETDEISAEDKSAQAFFGALRLRRLSYDELKTLQRQIALVIGSLDWMWAEYLYAKDLHLNATHLLVDDRADGESTVRLSSTKALCGRLPWQGYAGRASWDLTPVTGREPNALRPCKSCWAAWRRREDRLAAEAAAQNGGAE